MLTGSVLVGILLVAAPDGGDPAAAARAAAAAYENGLPPQAKAALAGMHIPGVTEPVADPTAQLPAELVAPWQIAMDFFTNLQHKDADGATAFSRPPFSFDGHAASSLEEVRKGWTRYLNLPKSYHPVLYSLDVYPYEEMLKRYGPPPTKLADVPFKGSIVAVANIDGRANIAVLRRDAGGPWRICAFSD